MWWWNNHENFGDWIGPYIYQKKTGKLPLRTHSTLNKPSIYSAGSIITFVEPGGIVWGSGIISSSGKPHTENVSIRSVRGPHTRNKILQCNIPCPEQYGDPGMVLPMYYNPETDKKYKLGILPHYVDYEKIKNSAIGKDPRVLVIDLKTKNVENVINELLQCEKTISSSLHGIIVSIAYNIPTKWVIFSNQIFGDGIKYWDFFCSLFPKQDHEELIKLSTEIIQYINKNKKVPNDPKYNDKLKNMMPYYLTYDFVYDDIVQLPIKYDYTEELISDILSTCPF